VIKFHLNVQRRLAALGLDPAEVPKHKASVRKRVPGLDAEDARFLAEMRARDRENTQAYLEEGPPPHWGPFDASRPRRGQERALYYSWTPRCDET
jgi:hypothetical protein